MSNTSGTMVISIPDQAYRTIYQYGDLVSALSPGATLGDVVIAILEWAAAGLEGRDEGYWLERMDKGRRIRYTSMRVPVQAYQRLTATLRLGSGTSSAAEYVHQCSLSLPQPPRPELLSPYLPKAEVVASTGSVSITFSKRQTAHLRHLARAWGVSTANVVQVLVASHPCMHLPVTITPPQVNEALRGVQQLPPAHDQEVLVIEADAQAMSVPHRKSKV